MATPPPPKTPLDNELATPTPSTSPAPEQPNDSGVVTEPSVERVSDFRADDQALWQAGDTANQTIGQPLNAPQPPQPQSMSSVTADMKRLLVSSKLDQMTKQLAESQAGSTEIALPTSAAAPSESQLRHSLGLQAQASTLTVQRTQMTVLTELLSFNRKVLATYLVKDLALSYQRTILAKDSLRLQQLVGATLAAKLEAIKLNTAAPEVAKISILDTVKQQFIRNRANKIAEGMADYGARLWRSEGVQRKFVRPVKNAWEDYYQSDRESARTLRGMVDRSRAFAQTSADRFQRTVDDLAPKLADGVEGAYQGARDKARQARASDLGQRAEGKVRTAAEYLKPAFERWRRYAPGEARADDAGPEARRDDTWMAAPPRPRRAVSLIDYADRLTPRSEDAPPATGPQVVPNYIDGGPGPQISGLPGFGGAGIEIASPANEPGVAPGAVQPPGTMGGRATALDVHLERLLRWGERLLSVENEQLTVLRRIADGTGPTPPGAPAPPPTPEPGSERPRGPRPWPTGADSPGAARPRPWGPTAAAQSTTAGRSVFGRRLPPTTTLIKGAGIAAGLAAPFVMPGVTGIAAGLAAPYLASKLSGWVRRTDGATDTVSPSWAPPEPTSGPAPRKPQGRAADGLVTRSDLADLVQLPLLNIHRLLDERLARRVSGDGDGDGVRDGSWQAQKRRREEDGKTGQADRAGPSGGLGALLRGGRTAAAGLAALLGLGAGRAGAGTAEAPGEESGGSWVGDAAATAAGAAAGGATAGGARRAGQAVGRMGRATARMARSRWGLAALAAGALGLMAGNADAAESEEDTPDATPPEPSGPSVAELALPLAATGGAALLRPPTPPAAPVVAPTPALPTPVPASPAASTPVPASPAASTPVPASPSVPAPTSSASAPTPRPSSGIAAAAQSTARADAARVGAAAAHAASSAATHAGTNAAAHAAERAGAHAATAAAARTALRAAGTKIPVAGAVIGAGFGLDRMFNEGDVVGGAAEIASGLVAIVPFVGTGASVAIDAWLGYRDYTRATDVHGKLIEDRIKVYGVDDPKLIDYTLALEKRVVETVRNRAPKLDEDAFLAIAGHYGLDPKLPQSVKFIGSWVQLRLVPAVVAYLQALGSVRLDYDKADTMSAVQAEQIRVELQRRTEKLVSKYAKLRPTKEGLQEFLKWEGREPETAKPTTIPQPPGFDPTAKPAAIVAAPPPSTALDGDGTPPASVAPSAPSAGPSAGPSAAAAAGPTGTPPPAPTGSAPLSPTPVAVTPTVTSTAAAPGKPSPGGGESTVTMTPVAGTGASPTPGVMDANTLGSLSAKEESGNRGSAAVGYDGTGGTSYGKYQIASKTGTFGRWLKWLQSQGGGAAEIAQQLQQAGPANTGSREGAVPTLWKQLAASGKLGNLEHEFIKATHYDIGMRMLSAPVKQRVQSSNALRQVLWSTAVQHGPGGAKIFNETYVPDQSLETWIRKIYQVRGTRFGSSKPAVRASVQARFRRESEQAIAWSKTESPANTNQAGSPAAAAVADSGAGSTAATRAPSGATAGGETAASSGGGAMAAGATSGGAMASGATSGGAMASVPTTTGGAGMVASAEPAAAPPAPPSAGGGVSGDATATGAAPTGGATRAAASALADAGPGGAPAVTPVSFPGPAGTKSAEMTQMVQLLGQLVSIMEAGMGGGSLAAIQKQLAEQPAPTSVINAPVVQNASVQGSKAGGTSLLDMNLQRSA